MNEASLSNPAIPYGAKPDPGVPFIDGAVRTLAASVSAAASRSATPPGTENSALARTLRVVLDHFGLPADEASLVAARGDEVETIIRRTCEVNDLHVRPIELAPDENRAFAGPVLAFRGGAPVVLLPAVHSKWTEVGAVQCTVPLDPRAYAFYRGLRAIPLRFRDLWLAVVGRENRNDMLTGVAWGLAAAALSAASVLLMRALVEWALPQGDYASLSLLAASWCVVALTASNLRLSRALLQARVGTRIAVAAEAALVRRALSLPLSEYKGIGAGDVSERILSATEFGKVAFGNATNLLLAGATVLAYGAMLASTSARAALVVGCLLLVRATVGGALLFGMFRSGRAQAVARGKMSALLFEMLTGISRIKVASAEPRALYRWARSFAAVRRASYRSSVFSGYLTAVEGFFDVSGTIVLYAVGCGTSGGAGLDVGAFIVAAACLAGLHAAYSEVVSAAMQLLPLVPKAERVRPLLRAAPEVQAGAASAQLDGNVSLRNITFHYAEDDVRILDDITVEVRAGEFVAIVGPSGCGKSTLIKMILGFFAPTSGTVLLDGKDLANLDLRRVRRQIGAVLQGSELLPSSIHFNIVGTTNKTMEDAWLAAQRACIAEDIEVMPMKMFTVLSDRAVTISGGQKQRILIARALVREPKLLIFDEATSALDNKTQAGVMTALREMSCTKICIAHRLSTILHADRILVMERGRIVQEGTFHSLMAREGLFRKLARSQFAQAGDAQSSG